MRYRLLAPLPDASGVRSWPSASSWPPPFRSRPGSRWEWREGPWNLLLTGHIMRSRGCGVVEVKSTHRSGLAPAGGGWEEKPNGAWGVCPPHPETPGLGEVGQLRPSGSHPFFNRAPRGWTEAMLTASEDGLPRFRIKTKPGIVPSEPFAPRQVTRTSPSLGLLI